MLFFVVLASLLAVAVLIRAPGVGKWCLTEDEYYYSKPVALFSRKGCSTLEEDIIPEDSAFNTFL
jgi:hypothetical protein